MVIQVERDLFESGADIILHQVNCQGVMGSGVAAQVRSRFPWVFARYRDKCIEHKTMKFALHRDSELLGQNQYVYIDESNMIGNLFAQDQFGRDGKRYTDYAALEKCLRQADKDFRGKRIAVPHQIGCGRGGGDWAHVKNMLHEIFDNSSNTLMICKRSEG